MFENTNRKRSDQFIENLKSPLGTPFTFSVNIQNDLKGEPYTFEIASHSTGGTPAKTSLYNIAGKDHASFLNFFEQLSVDFGLRLPQNRRPRYKPSFKARYNEILVQNIHPQILYGYGDPALIIVDGTNNTSYYLVATSNDAPNSFPLLRSENLVDWEFINCIFPKENKPPWALSGDSVSDYWAPEMHKVNNEFRLYFVARDNYTTELCIGMAKSSHPEKPFEAEATPILKNNVIDPHIFVENDGTAYLYWKEDNNDTWPGKLLDVLYKNPNLIPVLFKQKEDQLTASFILTIWPWAKALGPMERFQSTQIFIEAVTTKFADFYNELMQLNNVLPANMKNDINVVLHYMKTPMYAQQLSEDGTALIGEPTKVLENDLAWEAHLVEGMWVTKKEKRYYLFYAGNDFSTEQYGIGVAIADSPLGPFKKMPKQLLQSTTEWSAPGHPSVVVAATGEHQMFFHAYRPGEEGYKKFRALLSIPIRLEQDGVYLVSE